MRGPTARGCTIQGIARFVPGDPADFLRAIGLDPAMGPDDRVSARALVDAMALAVERTGDPALGPKIAWMSPPQRFDVMGYLFTAASTLREGWTTMCRTLRLWNAGFAMSLREEQGQAHVVLRCIVPRVKADTPGLQPLSELALTTGLITAQAATGYPLAPRQAAFMGTEPRDTTHLRAIFGENLRFEAPENVLTLDSHLLDLPLRQADPGLAAILARHADELLARLPDEGGPVARRVRAYLTQTSSPMPDLPEVARALGTSERSLQRHLREEGTSYQEIVEVVRKDLALRLLGEGELGIEQVAVLVGFSEASAFHRAFRRWTGQTPAEHRAQLSR